MFKWTIEITDQKFQELMIGISAVVQRDPADVSMPDDLWFKKFVKDSIKTTYIAGKNKILRDTGDPGIQDVI